jgi:hypothetical protein
MVTRLLKCPLEVSGEKGSPRRLESSQADFELASLGDVSVDEWLLGSECHLESGAGLA